MIYSVVVCNKYEVGYYPANCSRVSLTDVASAIMEHNAIYKVVLLSTINRGFTFAMFEVEERDTKLLMTYNGESIEIDREHQAVVDYINKEIL